MQWRRHLRAAALLRRGDRSGALEAYRRILDEDPNDPPALSFALPELRRLGDVEAVKRIATRALDHYPLNFTALDALAWAHITLEEHHAARPIVEQALRAKEALNLGAPFGWAERLAMSIGRALFPLLAKGSRRIGSADELAAEAARDGAAWSNWAHSYLASHVEERGERQD